MSDQELIEELTAHASSFQDQGGEVNPFVAYEYDLLTLAALRIEQLTGRRPTSGLPDGR